ncbi:hypothetical protein BaRGS_00019119 [Batillaria attramentaria]|uniref:Secreted protein n=1 Tax=Batillaria attramentaria TaxID=370345 RepID=A0ABD0KRB1_9CAEN
MKVMKTDGDSRLLLGLQLFLTLRLVLRYMPNEMLEPSFFIQYQDHVHQVRSYLSLLPTHATNGRSFGTREIRCPISIYFRWVGADDDCDTQSGRCWRQSVGNTPRCSVPIHPALPT